MSINNKNYFSFPEDFENLSSNKIKEKLSSFKDEIYLVISKGSYNEHYSIAMEYLEFAFIIHELEKVCSEVNYKHTSLGYAGSIEICIKYENPHELSNKVFWLKHIGDFESDFGQKFYEFEDLVFEGNIEINTPELIDSFFANYLGYHYEWSYESKVENFTANPEWKYHTWKSSWSKKLGFSLYLSPSYWVLSKEADVIKALKFCSDINTDEIEIKCIKNTISDLNSILLLTDKEALSLSFHLHDKINELGKNLFPLYEDDLFESARDTTSLGEFKIANDLSFLVFESKTFKYVIFAESFRELGVSTIEEILKIKQELILQLMHISGDALKYFPDWSIIDDEKFELICYDLVMRSGKFNKDKVTKMGLSRSRDGGRDIVAYTIGRIGAEPEQWIIQCKFTSKKKSLGRNDILLAELIDEYNPAGVIIATNATIDSTLFDKYTKIGTNRKCDIIGWGKVELDRKLNQNPDLYDLYFKK